MTWLTSRMIGASSSSRLRRGAGAVAGRPTPARRCRTPRPGRSRAPRAASRANANSRFRRNRRSSAAKVTIGSSAARISLPSCSFTGTIGKSLTTCLGTSSASLGRDPRRGRGPRTGGETAGRAPWRAATSSHEAQVDHRLAELRPGRSALVLERLVDLPLVGQAHLLEDLSELLLGGRHGARSSFRGGMRGIARAAPAAPRQHGVPRPAGGPRGRTGPGAVSGKRVPAPGSGLPSSGAAGPRPREEGAMKTLRRALARRALPVPVLVLLLAGCATRPAGLPVGLDRDTPRRRTSTSGDGPGEPVGRRVVGVQPALQAGAERGGRPRRGPRRLRHRAAAIAGNAQRRHAARCSRASS